MDNASSHKSSTVLQKLMKLVDHTIILSFKHRHTINCEQSKKHFKNKKYSINVTICAIAKDYGLQSKKEKYVLRARKLFINVLLNVQDLKVRNK